MIYRDTWTLSTFLSIRKKINPSPIYQRQTVWTMSQKQLLMDSIVRKYDVPKIYLHQKNDGTFDVIDGQQRIRTFWEFFKDEFALPKNAAPVDGIEVANKKYSELGVETVNAVNNYNINIVLVVTENLGEISDMFLRLQNGTKLKAQEIRNALLGPISTFVTGLAKHKFFQKVGVTDKRGNHDLIAAQMTLLAINKGVCNVQKPDLDAMYVNHNDFDENGAEAKLIVRVLNYLNKMFSGEKSPYLKKNYIIISLFLLIMDLLEHYDIKGKEKDFFEWFKKFEFERECNKGSQEYAEYQIHISRSTDGMKSLRYRHDFLRKRLLEAFPDLANKDPQRLFDVTQRLIIYHRDGGICKKCHKPCTWEEASADHIIPHSKGGPTTIENGQLLHKTCNAKKGAKEE